MEAVLNWLWQGSVVTLVLFVMLRLLERASASVRYGVCWAVVLLVLALPLSSWLLPIVPGPAVFDVMPTEAFVSVPAAWWTSTAAIAAAWLAWTSVGVVRFLYAIAALRRARAGITVFPTEPQAALPHWCRIRTEGRRATLALSETVTTAAVLGWGRPVIAVAPSLLSSLEPEELDRVLVHEWAHVQRRDDVANLMQVAIRIVAGWHPAVWWIDRRLHLEREIACDERAVALTGAPKSYASCLLKLTALKDAEQTALAAPAALSGSGLRARVTRIVAARAFIKPVWSRGIGAAIVSALCGVTLIVGDLKLVGETVIAIPHVTVVRAGSERANPSVSPTAPVAQLQTVSAPRPRVPMASAASLQPADGGEGAQPLSIERPALPLLDEPLVVTASGLPPASDFHAVETLPSPAVDTPQPPPVPESSATPPAATAEDIRTPWAVATEQGTALGRKSKDAGVATAGAFTRFARKLAGSF